MKKSIIKFLSKLTVLAILVFIILNEYLKRSEKKFILKNIFNASYKSICECKNSITVNAIKLDDCIQVSVFENKTQKVISAYTIEYNDIKSSIHTCSLFNNLRRGRNQKVIGYSLYGKNKFYYAKLKNITRQAKLMYPDWVIRVYYDDSIDTSIICEIECQKDNLGNLLDNSDFCNINDLSLKLYDQNRNKLNAFYIHAMMWRWFPIGDSFVDIFSSRDTDSNIILRERDSVNAWLDSDKVGHIMRDHPEHTTSILGGMWGFYNSRNRDLASYIFSYIIDFKISAIFNKDKNVKQADQTFLREYIYPKIKKISIIHDSYLCTSYGGGPFPTERVGDCFIGSTAECYSNRTFYKCPDECRPADHPNWISC